jgi:hypothetical protein
MYSQMSRFCGFEVRSWESRVMRGRWRWRVVLGLEREVGKVMRGREVEVVWVV